MQKHQVTGALLLLRKSNLKIVILVYLINMLEKLLHSFVNGGILISVVARQRGFKKRFYKSC